jgi:hypothetical protein
MGLLLNVYQVYYILAGIAGLALYCRVARICWDRFQCYVATFDKSVATRDLLVGALAILACTAEVQFCFSRAALLIRLAA